jgi:pyridoxamine 5'-phosphate oxidase
MPDDIAAPRRPAPPNPAPAVAVPLDADPFELLRAWLSEAEASEPNDPNAMTLATVGADGRPSARIVLLKGLDHGLSFFTNKESRKGRELSAHRDTALVFHWKTLRRQVRVEGAVEDVTEAEADAYFRTRARVSRIGAAASDQSRPLPSREVLERRVAELSARYPGDEVPRPAHWSGYRLIPTYFEFWQDMPFRLHDRTIFSREGGGGGWRGGKLYP